MTTTSTEVRLVSRPEVGADAGPDNFALATVDVPSPGDGEVTVRNTAFSVDPYMRGRINDVKSYVPPFAIDAALQGSAVGVVTESRSPQLPEGTLVQSMFGWREAFTAPASQLQALPDPPAGVSATAYLGVLGVTGFTAWIGLTQTAPVAEGDVVFVSAAAGAVGSVAGQLARARGASRVIGSAGAPAKVAALTEIFGYDAGFTHLDNDTVTHLAELAPKGIDVYFDNVGGEQLDAALVSLRPFGRVALCGGISTGYSGGASGGIANLGLAVGKRLSLRGFIVSDHFDQQPAFREEVGGLLSAGKLTTREHAVSGVANAPRAFLDLFGGGDQIGKVVVTV